MNREIRIIEIAGRYAVQVSTWRGRRFCELFQNKVHETASRETAFEYPELYLVDSLEKAKTSKAHAEAYYNSKFEVVDE